MTDRELERRLAQAVEHAAPEDLEGLLSRCQERKGTVIAMTNRNKRTSLKSWAALAACLALLLVGGGGGYLYQQAHAVASVVSLDVNPSVELNVNRSQKVLSCVGLNDDADGILKDMDGGADLEGTKLDVAVNAIVGAMVRGGYLDDLSSAILISVEDEDSSRAARLRRDLSDTVGRALGDQSAAASILTQTVESDDDLEELAQANNISTGKAVLVERLMEMNGDLTFDGLAALSVEELCDLEELGAPAMPIGKDKALEYAMTYAGVTDLSGLDVDVDAELDEDVPCYEVELGDMECRVDAWSGKILSAERDDDRDDEDDDRQPAAPAGLDRTGAVNAALTHAGLHHSQVHDLEAELDHGCWAVEFEHDGCEYEYEISAADGSVRHCERDHGDNGCDNQNHHSGHGGKHCK